MVTPHYSYNMSLGEILFSVNFASGFIYTCYSMLMNGRTDFYFLGIYLKEKLSYSYKDVFHSIVYNCEKIGNELFEPNYDTQPRKVVL